MKRVVVIAALLLCAQVVSAQPSCWPNLSLPTTLQKTSDGPARVGDIVYAASSIGLVWGYACIASDGTMRHIIVGGPWTAFQADWLAVADQLYRGTDADRAAAWSKYVTATTIDARLQPDVDAIKAVLPKPVAPAPAGSWVVAATSICAAADKDTSGRCVRRQSFAWDGTTRGLVAQPERATIGSACITSIGKEPYFGFDAQRPDRVVLCVKQ